MRMRYFYFSWRPEGLFGLFFLLHLLVLGFIIWMLVDAVTRGPEDFGSPNTKTGWIVGLAVSLLFPFPGLIAALVYFFSVRKQAQRRSDEARTRSPDAPPLPGTGIDPSPPPPPPMPAPTPRTNCRSCGAKLVAGARFCHSCGTPVE